MDFADAALVFESPDKVTVDSVRNGEERSLDLAITEVHGRLLAPVYVLRGSDVRVISFRIASKDERKLYAKYKKQD